MSLASFTLSAIQQAGAAVYAADVDLKQATKDYATRVAAAMGENPFGLGNDALFENWKLTARLSQSMAAIEAELKKIYFLAESLEGEDASVLTALPSWVPPVSVPATDVKVKPKPKPKTKTGALARENNRRKSTKPPLGQLPGNAAKLLQYLETVLSADDFSVIKSTASARAVGIPLGSVSAAIKMLVARGYLIAGSAGGFKLNHVNAAGVMV